MPESKPAVSAEAGVRYAEDSRAAASSRCVRPSFVETARNVLSLIRYGQMTKDELFVSADAVANGIAITNKSDTENLVFLKHFGPGYPQAPVSR